MNSLRILPSNCNSFLKYFYLILVFSIATAMLPVSGFANNLTPKKSTIETVPSADYFSPIAIDDVYQMVEGTTLMADVSINDSDPNGLPLTYTIVGIAMNGTLTLTNNGSFNYTPLPGFTGVDAFKYAVTNTNNETSQADVTININPCLLNADILGQNVACTEEQVGFDAQSNNVGITYKWEFGLNAIPTTSTDPNPIVSWLTPGNQTIVLTITDSICTLYDTAYIDIIDGGFSNAGLNQSICQGASIQIGGAPSGPSNATFQWTPITGLDNPNAANPIAMPTDSTVYTLEVSVNGCAPKTSDVLVAVKPEPFADAGVDYAVCSGTQVTLGGSPSGAFGSQYSWSPTTGLDDPFSSNPILTTTSTTTYTLTVEYNGCYSTDEVIVGVLPQPFIHPLNNEYICLGDTNGILIGTQGIPNLSYQWSPTTGLADPTSSTTVATPTETTVYNLCVTNQVGCVNCQQLTVIVNDCNEPPLALNDDNITILNSPVTGNVLVNDRDRNMNILEFKQIIVPPSNGTIVINVDGAYTYTPDPGFLGTEYLEYEVCDTGSAIAGCDTANLKIKVSVNDTNNNRPLAIDDTYILAEGTTSFNGRFSSNDGDPDNDDTNITIMPLSNPIGSVSILSNGDFSYVPVNGFLGQDTFLYELCDVNSNVLCDTGVVTFILEEDFTKNRAPVAKDDFFGIELNGVLKGNILENDADPEGSPITLNQNPVSGPSNGVVSLQVNGLYEYIPNGNFVGHDVFVYEITDINGNIGTAKVDIDVFPFNNNTPIAFPDYLTTLSGNLIDIDVIANDIDTDEDLLTLNTSPLVPPANGTVIMLNNGLVRYTPTSGFVGSDVFTYEICDNISGCANATVHINVISNDVLVGEAPEAAEDHYSIFSNMTLTGNLLDNDLDPDGDTLSMNINLIDDPDFGQGALNVDGSFSYNPNTSYTGIDQFVYEVCDPVGNCDTVTVYINILDENSLNSPPNALDNHYTTSESTPLNGNVLTNDFDADADVFTINLTPTQNPGFGTVSLAQDGSFSYIPTIGFRGFDEFSYEICDNKSNCDIATVFIQVTRGTFGLQPNNIPPRADDDAIVTYVDQPAIGRMDFNDFDPEFSFVIYATAPKVPPTNGTVTIDSTGGYVYTPNPGYSGPDNFVYTVCDAVQTCVEATVYIIVYPYNNPPIAIEDDNNTLVNYPLLGQVMTNDFDIDNDNLIVNPILITNPANGSVVFNADGTYDYIPATDFIGTDSFEYEVCDDGDPGPICSIAKVNINVLSEGQTAINSAPIANDDDLVTYLDREVSSNVLANDHDTELDSMTAIVLQQPDFGLLIMTPDGQYTYDPNQDYEGSDSFVYQVCDDGSPIECTTATAFIEVLPPPSDGVTNYKPFAADDFAVSIADSFVQGNVLLNDIDLDDDPLTTTTALLFSPTNGTFTLLPNGDYIYTPNPGYIGPDQCTYEVCDGIGGCSEATIYFVTRPNRCIGIQLAVFMEGPYNVVGDTMNTFLNLKQGSALHRGLLPGQTPLNIGLGVQPTPSGQPYYKDPWFYPGTEGAGWTNTNYDHFEDVYGNSVVDWVIVSFRTNLSDSTTILQMAGILMDDGQVVFMDECNFTLENTGQYYVVIEHRNHMGIMTPNPIPVIDNTLEYDFTSQDSYTGVNGFGCKELEPGVWGMYAGDGDQSDFPSYDINGSDKILWTNDNGFFDKYILGDYNMNGDVNGADRILWDANNGVTSRVPKN